MARWSLDRHDRTPHQEEPQDLSPTDARHLTASEIRAQRLALAEDMIQLVYWDRDGLPAPVQRTLQGLCETLGKLRRQTRGLGVNPDVGGYTNDLTSAAVGHRAAPTKFEAESATSETHILAALDVP